MMRSMNAGMRPYADCPVCLCDCLKCTCPEFVSGGLVLSVAEGGEGLLLPTHRDGLDDVPLSYANVVESCDITHYCALSESRLLSVYEISSTM